LDGEGVHAACQLTRKNPVNHAVAFEPGLIFEGLRHDIDPEMSLPARPVPGMAFVLVGFIHYIEALWRESLGQLLCDQIGGSHAALDSRMIPKSGNRFSGKIMRKSSGRGAGQCLIQGRRSNVKS
jgi:hypothetical protein